MAETPKWYDAHLKEYRKIAYINSEEQYDKLYKQSLEDPEGFWAEQARRYLSWDKEWDFVLKSDFNTAEIKWLPHTTVSIGT